MSPCARCQRPSAAHLLIPAEAAAAAAGRAPASAPGEPRELLELFALARNARCAAGEYAGDLSALQVVLAARDFIHTKNSLFEPM